MLMASEIMRRKVITIEPDETIATAISRMIENNIHHLPVTSSKKFLGMIGFDSLLRRSVIPVSTKVSTLMEYGPRGKEDSSAIDIAKLMVDAGRKAVAIVDGDEKLIGIITTTDIIKNISKIINPSEYKVGDIMSKEPITVNEDDDVDLAIKTMREIDEFSLPVVNEYGKLTGIINIEDFSRAYWRDKEKMSQGEYYRNMGKIKVKDVMVPPVFSKEEDSLTKCLKQMDEMNSKICVVVDNEFKPIGILTHSDLLDEIVKLQPQEGVLVNISGINFPDLETYDRIYEIIQRRIKGFGKINRLTPKILNLHFEEHKQQSGEIKYSVRGRLTTESRTFYARAWDWDLFNAVRELMDEFKRMIEKEKEKRLGE